MNKQKNPLIPYPQPIPAPTQRLKRPLPRFKPTRHELEPNDDDRSRAAGVPSDDEAQRQAAPTGKSV